MKEGVRFASTSEEFQAAYQLRYKVYVESMGRLGDKADHNSKELHDEYDKTARALIAIRDGLPAGTLRLFWGGDALFSESMTEAYHLYPFLKKLDQNKICIIERLMVSEKHRGSSTALRMYKEVMNFVINQKAELVLLNCEPHNINSYLKLGFRPFTKTYNYPGIGPVIPMALIVGDYQHYKDIGSPFSMLAKEEDLDYCRNVNELKKTILHESRAVRSSTSDNLLSFSHYHSFRRKFNNQTPKLFDESRLRLRLSA